MPKVVFLEKNVEISILLDLYGTLLTKVQQKAIKEHYDEDLSLAEIGDAMGKTRQSVYDAVKKGVTALYGYEKKLGVMERYISFEKDIVRIEKMVKSGENKESVLKELDRLKNLMEQ
jgi:predicted DNA-binding protein YlxM (UPF0122 family)